MNQKEHRKARRARLSPAKQALLAKRLTASLDDQARIIHKRPNQDTYPLSFAQERLWFLAQLEPESSTYNRPLALRLSGALDLKALEQALSEMVRRHEVLRATFSTVEGQPVLQIEPAEPIHLPVVDFSDFPASEREQKANHLLALAVKEPFDLSQNLFRATLLRLAQEEHILLMVIHHIAFDAWSANLFIQELSALYQADEPLPESRERLQYADFADWQRAHLQAERLAKPLSYWKEQLAGIEPLNLPTDHARPTRPTNRAGQQSLILQVSLVETLQALSQQEGGTLFMTLLAAWKLMLSRYTAQDDIAVGTPIAGRTHVETEGLIGCFLNTLVLRTDLSGGETTFRQLLTKVRQVTLEAYTHQELPFEKLVEKLQPEREPSRSPLFQVMFNLENLRLQPTNLGATLQINEFELDRATAQFDLTLEIVAKARPDTGRNQELTCLFVYNSELFEDATIRRMASHFQTLLEGIIANPDTPISDLPLLTEAERHQLLYEWNDTAAEYPSDKCVHQLFEAQVEKTPDAIALIFGDEQLTYRQLNARANQLAHHLIQLGVGPEVKVGICVERSIEMVVGLLGILKAGGAYVPLEPSYPKERLAFMLADAEVAVLLSKKQIALPKHTGHLVYLDSHRQTIALERTANPEIQLTPENLVDVLYTSGSTGKPKGVLGRHRGAVNRISWIQQTYPCKTGEICCQKTSLCFVDSVAEIFGPLSAGIPLVLIPDEVVQDPNQLISTLAKYQITRLVLVPSLLRAILDTPVSLAKRLPNLKQWISSGEALPRELVERFHQRVPKRTLLNLYGSSEVSADVTWYQTSPNQREKRVPIGRPIANCSVYILDVHQNTVPIGVPGTLYIGGHGLARGYLRPQTQERFVDNPFEVGSRLYNSGDQARYLPDGNIEFLGRKDHQVKIRGFRVELGEIEAALNSHPEVREAVVVARENEGEDKRLVAYVVSSSTQKVLRAYLASKLPNYMLPSAYVQLDALPLTPNGKVDRQALPAPTGTAAKSSVLKPRTLTEEMLSRIWVEVLGLEVYNYGTSEVDIEQNFFEAGGHSLSAVQFMSRIHSTFNIQLPLASLFEFPTIAGLASCLDQRAEQAPSDYQSLRPIRLGGKRPPFFLVPGGEGDEITFMLYAKWLYLLGSEPPIYGFYARGSQTQAPHGSVLEMAADYVQEMRTLQPEGPYFLGGECIGGKVAFEMGRQLQAQGQEVALLLLMDTAFSPLSHLGLKLGYRLRRLLKETIPRHLTSLRPLSPKEQIAYAASKLALLLPSRERMRQSAPKSEEDKRLAHQIKVKNNYLNLLMQYHPTEPYSGQLTLIYSAERQPSTSIKGWQSLARSGIELFTVPGTHREYLGANVQTTAAQVRHCLEAAYHSWDEG